MAIVKRCMCFDNVRSGSYASGVYTLVYALVGFIYFAIRIVQTANESHATAYFVTSIIGMIFCGLVFTTSIFMMLGVYQDLKGMLIPFVIIKTLLIVLQCAMLIVNIIELVRAFEWITLLFLLVMVVIIIVNIWCLLCVVSQYQELKAGRGMGN